MKDYQHFTKVAKSCLIYVSFRIRKGKRYHINTHISYHKDTFFLQKLINMGLREVLNTESIFEHHQAEFDDEIQKVKLFHFLKDEFSDEEKELFPKIKMASKLHHYVDYFKFHDNIGSLITYLKKIISSPNYPFKSHPNSGYYRSQTNILREHIQKEEYEEVKNILLTHLEKYYFEDIVVYEELGICYLKLGQYEESLEIWDLLASSEASYFYKETIAKNRALCLQHFGKIEQAIAQLKDVILNSDTEESIIDLFISLVRERYTQNEIQTSILKVPSTYFWKNTSIYGVEAEHLFIKFLDFEMFVNISVYLSIPTNRMRENLGEKILQFLEDSKFYEKFDSSR